MDVLSLRFGFCKRQSGKKDNVGKHIAQAPVEVRKLP